jgi:hypothetical protein
MGGLAVFWPYAKVLQKMNKETKKRETDKEKN